MTSVLNPTYLLAPNWTYMPAGPIALGNIVAKPREPHRVLSKPSKALPETTTATENNWKLETEKIRNYNFHVLTELAGAAKVKLWPKIKRSHGGSFTMKSLDTTYFVDEPSVEDITERVNESERVRIALNMDSTFCSPVYMVSGIKVAKGFRLTYATSSTYGIEAEGSGPATPGVSVAAGFGATIEDIRSERFDSGNDIIFAYQLLQIKPKGWGKEKVLDISGYRKGAFLGDDEDDTDGEAAAVEVEVGPTDVNDLIERQGNGNVIMPTDDQLVWLVQSS